MTLDHNVLAHHRQVDPDSCVAMAFEAVLKLTGKMPRDEFPLQQAWKNSPKQWDWGGHYHGKVLYGLRFQYLELAPRGPQFPLEQLFAKISLELRADRLLVCALRPTPAAWHAYVLYGEAGGEFLGVTWFFQQAEPHFLDRMKDALTVVQGGDISGYW